MDLAHRADRAGPDPFAGLADAVARVALVAHLRGHARLLGHLGHEPRLADVVRQRLLAVDVLSLPHGRQAHVGVQVIGRGHEHRVDGLFLVQHHAEVFVVGAAEVGRLLGVVLLDLGLDRQAGPPCPCSRTGPGSTRLHGSATAITCTSSRWNSCAGSSGPVRRPRSGPRSPSRWAARSGARPARGAARCCTAVAAVVVAVRNRRRVTEAGVWFMVGHFRKGGE